MRKILNIAPFVLLSSYAIAEPTWYGNFNINTNLQENYNPLIDELYMDSNYSYIGIGGQEKLDGYNSFAKRLKYKIEFDLEINDHEKPIKLNQAVTGFETNIGNIMIGHQKTIQSDLLLKPMNIFNASRIVALEETEYVDDVIENTIRIDSKVLGFYVGASISMDNSDPESRAIDSQSIGAAMRNDKYQYAFVYWKDNNWNNNEGVSYLGINFNYNFNIFGISGSVVKPTNASLPNTNDIAIAIKTTNTWDAKLKYGNVEKEWDSFGIGLESSLSKNIKTYFEYQNKDFKDDNIKNQSLISLGINYKL